MNRSVRKTRLIYRWLQTDEVLMKIDGICSLKRLSSEIPRLGQARRPKMAKRGLPNPVSNGTSCSDRSGAATSLSRTIRFLNTTLWQGGGILQNNRQKVQNLEELYLKFISIVYYRLYDRVILSSEDPTRSKYIPHKPLPVLAIYDQPCPSEWSWKARW